MSGSNASLNENRPHPDGAEFGVQVGTSLPSLTFQAFQLRFQQHHAVHPVESALQYHRASAEIPGEEGHGGAGFEEAEAHYARILPTVVFVMQSLDTLVVYGKRIAAWRSGIDVLHDRRCALQPTPFGIKTAKRFAEQLGPLPGCLMYPSP